MKHLKKIIAGFAVLASLFNISPSNTEESKSKKLTKLIFGGDVMLGGFIDSALEKNQNPFSNLESTIRDADISFCNLEGPFTKSEKKIKKEFNFKVEPEKVKYLREAGFDVVSLANNHSYDYDGKGLEDTLYNLDKSSIAYCGAGVSVKKARKASIIEKNGMKFAFLAYTTTQPSEMYANEKKPGVAYANANWIKEDVSNAKNFSDVVVVSLHSGIEKSHHPTEKQKELSRLAIDSGADIVIGHHPHVIEGIEVYKKKIIAYSLGNLVFGGSKSGRVKETILLEIIFNNNEIKDYNIIPVDVSKEVNYQPKKLEGAKKYETLRRLIGYSSQINPKK